MRVSFLGFLLISTLVPSFCQRFGNSHGSKANSNYDFNFKRVIVESDSEEAVELIVKVCGRGHSSSRIVFHISNSHVESMSYKFQHVYRETNKVADAFGLNRSHDLKIFFVVSHFVSCAMLVDTSFVTSSVVFVLVSFVLLGLGVIFFLGYHNICMKFVHRC
jgi:hypothetical protein